MVAPVKVSDIFFPFGGLNIVEVSANGISKSDEVNVATIFIAQLFLDFAPTGVGAITVAPEVYIQCTPFATGNEGWRPVIAPFVAGITTPNSSAVDGTEGIGETLIEETVTTGLSNGSMVFFKNASLQNSEWNFVQSVSANVSFTIFDGLTRAQTGSTWFNQAQYYRPIMDLSGCKRLRAFVNNNRNATARACAVRIGMNQLTSVA